MRDAYLLLAELNRLLPIGPGEDCRHALSIHPDGRLAIVVWVREVAVLPSRKGWREFFLDDTEWEKAPGLLAHEIHDAVVLTYGEPLALRLHISGDGTNTPTPIFTSRMQALGERLTNRRVIL
jgi:hypothetical protein